VTACNQAGKAKQSKAKQPTINKILLGEQTPHVLFLNRRPISPDAQKNFLTIFGFSLKFQFQFKNSFYFVL
jgi:hypothetical protein